MRKCLGIGLLMVAVMMVLGMLPGAFTAAADEAVVHPGDLDANWEMVISEAIAYLSGWQGGSNPIAYAIRAAYLWQNGENYHYEPGESAPLCWALGAAEGESPLEGEITEGEGEGEPPSEGEGEPPVEGEMGEGEVPLEGEPVEGEGENTFALTYTAGPFGSIAGDTTQIVLEGADGTEVEAVPDEGCRFVDWSDGSTQNPRTDKNIIADINAIANFALDITSSTIHGRIEVPENTPLDPTGFLLLSSGGESVLNDSWEFTDMPVWDSDAGQFLFVESEGNTSVLLMYARPEEITLESELVLTTSHVAQGIMAMHPVFFNLDDRQRREILDLALEHEDFPDLVLLINQALQTAPERFFDYDTFPVLYELAVAICNDAAAAWRDSQAEGEGKEQIGRSKDPHLDDWPENGMTLFNPHLLFYGVELSGAENGWTVLRGRDGLTQLIPPGWSPVVEKELKVLDGNYTVQFWKGQGAFWSSNRAEKAGAQANMLKTLFLALDALAPPGWNIATGIADNNDLIEWLTTHPSEQMNDIISIWEALNLSSADDSITVLKKIVEAMVNNGVYEGSLTQWVAQGIYKITDVDGRSLWRHFKTVNGWLNTFVKVLKVYDIVNEFVPYYGQVFFYRNHYLYELNVVNGILSLGYSEIAPDAVLSGSTATPVTEQEVTFDASNTTDDVDTLSSLSFRFDFESDGIWDTDWALGNATASHAYNVSGTKTCIVEVKDSDGLIAQAAYYLYVLESGFGTLGIDVTPDTGQWRLFGPASFGSMEGTGDVVLDDSPSGYYTLLCYDTIAGMDPPAAQTVMLYPYTSQEIHAIWTEEGGHEHLPIRVSNASGQSENPAISVDSTGAASIVWEDYRDGNWEIYFRRLDAAGMALTSEVRVTNTGDSSRNADVDTDESGYSRMVWQEGQNIVFCVLDSQGNKTVANTTLSSGSCSNPAITVNPEGISRIVWEKCVITLYRVYFCQVDATGNKIGADIVLANLDIIGMTPKAPDISLDNEDNSHIVWRDYYDWRHLICYAQVDMGGALIIGPSVVIEQDHATYPRVHISPDDWNIVFQDSRSGANQIYYITGIKEDIVISNSTGNARKPTICTDVNDSSTLFVAWNDSRGEAEEVYLRRITPGNGEPIGEEILVSEPGNSSTEVDLKVRNGVCYLAWQDSRDGNTEIYMRQWK